MKGQRRRQGLEGYWVTLSLLGSFAGWAVGLTLGGCWSVDHRCHHVYREQVQCDLEMNRSRLMYIVHAISKYSCKGAVHKVYTNEIQPMDTSIQTLGDHSFRSDKGVSGYQVKKIKPNPDGSENIIVVKFQQRKSEEHRIVPNLGSNTGFALYKMYTHRAWKLYTKS